MNVIRKLGKSVLGVEKEIDSRIRSSRSSNSGGGLERPRESWMFNYQLTPSAPLIEPLIEIECTDLEEEEPPPSYKQEKLSFIRS